MRKSTHTVEYARLRRRLAELRSAAGLSQRQLATVLRVPHSWVAKVEAGERRIDLIEFSWYCAGCRASPSAEAARFLGDPASVSTLETKGRVRKNGGRR